MERRAIDLAHEPDFTIGDLVAHPSTRELSQGGVRSVVEPRVMQVLVALAQADGAVVSKDDLLARCWDGRIVGEDAINRVMSRLRRLSEETAAFRIETVTRIGYRLVTAAIEARGARSEPLPLAANDDAPSATRVSRRLIIGGGATLAAAATAGVWTVYRDDAAGAPKSVAVIPFRSADGQAQQYFSDGLSQEITVELASIPGLKVIAPTSVALASKSGGGGNVLANRLGVDLVLSGSVQRQGNVMRLLCDLADARSGYTLWADSFDRRIDDVFKVQREIADQVAGIVSVQAMPVQRSTDNSRVGGTSKGAAYDAYLKGLNLLEKGRGEESARAAIRQFAVALESDPKFARAIANQAVAYASLAIYFSPTPQVVAANMTQAYRLARQAIALAPDLPMTNRIMGNILMNGQLDFAAARPYYERAYRTGAGLAVVQSSYATFCALTGRAAAADIAIARAIELDPLSPTRRATSAQVALLNHDYATVIQRAAETLALDPKTPLVRAYLGDALIMLRRFSEARDAYAAEPREVLGWTGLAIAAYHLGEPDAARQWHERLASRHGDSASYQHAQIWAQRNDPQKAIEALEVALRVRDTGMTLLLRDPMLDPIRTQPGYAPMARRLRLV